MKMACILAAAFLLDCLLGDPHWLPHPICLIGKRVPRIFLKNGQVVGRLNYIMPER